MFMTRAHVQSLVYSVDDAHESAAIIEPGECITLKLQNAFGKSFESPEEFASFFATENQASKQALNHPCTGPIEVKTQDTNISLAIHILETKATRGYHCISKTTGLLKDKFPERSCRIIDFTDDQKVCFKDEDLILKTHPKIGFISTIDSQVRSVGRACENGGNIDLNYLDKGSTIYLPVNNSRARFLVGDLHVCQGNGEAAGCALEADGEVMLQVEVVDKINFPIIDDKHRLIIVGWGETIDASLKRSVENSLVYLKRVFPFCDWSETEIYKLISAEGNLVLGNATGHVTTCGMVFYKKRLVNKFGFAIFK
jgi:amidase